MSKTKLALFDLDGTLFDTDEVNYRAYRDALKILSITLEKDFFLEKCVGKHYKDFLPLLLKNDAEIEFVHTEKKKKYITYIGEAKKNKALFSLIETLKSDYYIGVVTTASKQNALDIIRFFGCEEDFDLILTQEDVIRKKPDPEGYIKAMQYFNIGADDTIVFEDSQSGIQSAKDSGASVYAVYR